jgi:hypothetical protein
MGVRFASAFVSEGMCVCSCFFFRGLRTLIGEPRSRSRMLLGLTRISWSPSSYSTARVGVSDLRSFPVRSAYDYVSSNIPHACSDEREVENGLHDSMHTLSAYHRSYRLETSELSFLETKNHPSIETPHSRQLQVCVPSQAEVLHAYTCNGTASSIYNNAHQHPAP